MDPQIPQPQQDALSASNVPVQPTPPIPPSTLSTPPSPVLSPLSKVASFLLVVSLLALGAYFAGNYYLKTKVPVSSPIPTATVTPVPSATSDPTADWKTYTNTKYGYSFRYPINYSVGTKGDSNPITANGITIADNCNFDQGQRCLQGFINSATPFKKDNKLADYYIYAPGQTPTILNEKQIYIDNEPALAREIYDNNYYYSSTEKGIVDYDIYVVHSETVFALTFREQGKDQSMIKSMGDWQKTSIVGQILSTFKFLDGSAVENTVYKDSQNRYSFSYPSDWKVVSTVPQDFLWENKMFGGECRGPILQNVNDNKQLIALEIVAAEGGGGFCWSGGIFYEQNKWRATESSSWKGDYFVFKQLGSNTKLAAYAGLVNRETYALKGEDAFKVITSTFKFTD